MEKRQGKGEQIEWKGDWRIEKKKGKTETVDDWGRYTEYRGKAGTVNGFAKFIILSNFPLQITKFGVTKAFVKKN